ncbi:MAG: hypothetical protein J07HN4v3_02914, partial [Halonotius sp. J07HN4]
MTSSVVPARSLVAAGLPIVAGVIAGGHALQIARDYRSTAGTNNKYADLQWSYLWSCIVFAIGAVILGGVRLQQTGPTVGVRIVFWIFTFIFSIPWAVFAFRYAGRGQLITTRRVVIASGFVGTIVLTYYLSFVRDAIGPLPILSALIALMLLGLTATVFGASGLVLLSAYRHSSLTLSHGLFAALPVMILWFSLQLSLMTSESLPLFADGVIGVAFLTGAGGLVIATTRYDVLSMRPGTGTVGERAAVRELDEAVVTIEANGTLARANTTARELFGEQIDEESVVDIVGHEPSALDDQETISCWTTAGRKQFYPRVTELVTDDGDIFGYSITLIDITDREMRRQRIEVLNRILRHNIRNSLDIINADAELVADEARADSILDTTDTLHQLTGDARRIESLLRRPADERTTAELPTIVSDVATTLSEEYSVASVSVEIPDLSVTVDADLFQFALHNVIENAIVHNDAESPRVEITGSETETGARVVVAD